MRSRPDDLPDTAVAEALRRWSIEAAEAMYAPIGFGDHHWHVRGADGRRWFVTVAELARKPTFGADVTDSLDGLRRAMDTAWALRDGCLDAVVAPERDADGETVGEIGGGYALSVFPHVDGEPGDFGREQARAEREATIALLATLHRQPPPAATPLIPWDPPARERLEAALAALGSPWDGGPYAEPARAALSEAAPRVRTALARLDTLAAELRSDPPPLVVTHGEPHPGNLIATGDGLRLVDWDTVGRSVPERDLWSVARDHADLDIYEQLTGHRPRRDLMELFRVRWDLGDIAEIIGWFRAPHQRTADLETGWTELRASLERTA